MFRKIKARIIARREPEPGEEFTVYLGDKELDVGDQVVINPPGSDISGVVVERHADNPRYQNQKLCGGKVVNTGKGYYKIKAGDKHE